MWPRAFCRDLFAGGTFTVEELCARRFARGGRRFAWDYLLEGGADRAPERVPAQLTTRPVGEAVRGAGAWGLRAVAGGAAGGPAGVPLRGGRPPRGGPAGAPRGLGSGARGGWAGGAASGTPPSRGAGRREGPGGTPGGPPRSAAGEQAAAPPFAGPALSMREPAVTRSEPAAHRGGFAAQ